MMFGQLLEDDYAPDTRNPALSITLPLALLALVATLALLRRRFGR